MNPFDTTGFPARWSCGIAWELQPWIGWLHIISDIVIFLAYFAVPVVVMHFVRQRDDLRFPPVFYGFLAIIFFSCGTVHLVESAIFWWPVYKLSGLAKLVTAVASATGVVLLVRVLPAALDLKSGAAFAAAVEERQRVQEELKNEQFLLRTMLSNLPDFIYFKDKDSRFTHASDALAKFFGLDSPKDLVGKTDRDFFLGEFAASARDDEVNLMETGEPLIGKEESQNSADGKHMWLSASKLPMRDDSGKVIGMFGLSRDITPQKRAAEVMEEAKRAAEEANLSKSEFLANMSHEIRTPMNGIMGMTELLLATELNKQQRDYVELINHSTDSLLTVITDILDFSKIEAGKLQLDPREFDLRESLGNTLQALGIRADEKNLELAFRVAPDVPDRLVGDISRIRQVLVNLVGNALKFTEEGEVVVNVGVRAKTPDGIMVHFAVKDSGIGVPKEKQSQIFESFTQAESSTTRTYGGTGLGLPISRRLVELMKGRLWVESEKDKGSTFHFTAFLEAHEDEGKATEAAPASLKDQPVLVVDDNDTNRRIIEEMLNRWEMAPGSAASGTETLEILAAAHESGERYKLVLLDIAMPGMDGLEVARRIDEKYGKDAPGILILSSAGHPIPPEKATGLGIDRVLAKPVKQGFLLKALIDFFGTDARDESTSPPAAAAAAPRPAHIPSMKVLLAEDGRVNQLVVVKMLKKRGHSVVVAEDGKVAIDEHEKHPFDAILMDVQMPHLDGFGATRIIRDRERESGDHVPIIAMTANAMKGDREKCLDAGMDDYIAKPVRADKLFTILEKHAPADPPMD